MSTTTALAPMLIPTEPGYISVAFIKKLHTLTMTLEWHIWCFSQKHQKLTWPGVGPNFLTHQDYGASFLAPQSTSSCPNPTRLLSCYVTQLGLHPNSTDQIDQPLISQTGLWISVTTPKWNPPTKEECLSQLSYSLKWVTRSERNTPKKVVSERLGTMEQHWNMSKTIVALRASSSTPERMSACSCHLAPQLPCLF